MLFKRLITFAVTATTLFLAVPKSAAAADLCEDLQWHYLEVHANGYVGTTNQIDGIQLTRGQDGTYSFTTTLTFPNEPADQVKGTCKDRNIVFQRIRENSFVQTYEGWIFEQNGNEMAGTISNRDQIGWGWYAIAKPKLSR